MSKQSQILTTVSPQPILTLAGTPERLSASRIVRSVIIEASKGNTDDMFIASTEANATSTNRHILEPGDLIVFEPDEFGNLDAQMDLRDLWFNGVTTGDKLVVSFYPIDVEID